MRTLRDAAPTPEALRARDRIVRTSARRHRRALALGWASGLAVATAGVVIAAFVVIVPPTTARAGAPAALLADITSPAWIVNQAAKNLAVAPGPVEPRRDVQTASWNFSINGGTGELKVFTQLSTLSWEADGSGHATNINSPEGDPDDAAWYSHLEIPDEHTDGVLVDDLPLAPGDFLTPVTDPPAGSRAAIQGALESLGMPSTPSAFEVVTAVTTLFGQWTLTNEQHARVLEIIRDAGDATAVPRTLDRLGRPIDGLRVVSSDGAVSDVVFVSADTGRIIGMERTVVKADPLLPTGTILGYQLWDVEGLVG
ncbi:MAG: hypothetical protein P0Y60_11865 [Candidatus Microbacterium colombiense]|nr:MAG: hypothetical protein P0Y60_11865 [Microbacterium sp.]